MGLTSEQRLRFEDTVERSSGRDPNSGNYARLMATKGVALFRRLELVFSTNAVELMIVLAVEALGPPAQRGRS